MSTVNDTNSREAIEPDDIIREVQGGGMLATLDRAEVDIQIATAKRYPRSIAKFKQEALMMATLDEETAASMFYALPRGGRTIEGPAVRLAEIVGTAWGNLRYGARTVGVEDRYIVTQGAAFDLEKNVACTIEVRRRITNRRGERYDDDMITVTGNAGMSVALRNAIFKVVPFAYVKAIYEEAKLVAVGKGVSMEQRRSKVLDWYGKLGVRPEQVCRVVGRAAAEDLTLEDIVTLRGLATAIKDGETTFEAALAAAEQRGTSVTVDTLTPKAPPATIVGATVTGANDAPAGSNAPKRDEAPQVPAPKPAEAPKAVTPPQATKPAQPSLADF